eukprot:gnl/TRDRNA2_/TRDRNA2_163477_c0_seq3.p1 gnl/TRDRNA2_/TRDRNA2_163477_c0~~gnl/TRDRNA2_/TRDRNA2_163477_c0_seq3.p1  ORF type:complete len:412 (-),score=58.79 gnl/TRDRNA2_/TRDRNA2_163477_c0_seq3:47-1282(-)
MFASMCFAFLFSCCETEVTSTDDAEILALVCRESSEMHFVDELFPNSGAQALARPGEDFHEAFDASESRLLGCQALGHAPWRFGHNIVCVAAPACDSELLVREVALPFYLEAVGVPQPAEVLQGFLLQRLAHWKDMRADFVVAGFESGGSTSLVSWLRQASDIYMMPFELSDWARDFSQPKEPAPPCDASLNGPPSYWPAFMSYAFWPAADTVARFNAQAMRCAQNKLIGVWDSRYVAHELAVRKVQALVGSNPAGRVLLSFRDPVKYVVSTFNRAEPNSPGGGSFEAVVAGDERCPDPYGLQLWKGNYSIMTQAMMSAVGEEKVILQSFETILANPAAGFNKVLPHENVGPRGPDMRVNPCSAMHAVALQRLEALYAAEYVRLARLLSRQGQKLPPAVIHRQPDWACLES